MDVRPPVTFVAVGAVWRGYHAVRLERIKGQLEVLAFPFIVKPGLGEIIVPPPPKPVYALPKAFQPEPFLVTLMEPERDLYQISDLVNDGGRLVAWVVAPQRWVVRFVPGQDAYLVQSEDLGSAWTAPPVDKFEPILIKPVPWDGQKEPAYPTEFLFRFTKL
ncbi:hypothetical protein F5J12DRAFT_478155 [Pisolithus orientalis]|uniref:uncharacterized protein n=1 Tax=Pisolithus orientalis TaxID=936130 RepID=UPI0022248BDB|nr:uncharacterized protein F5J12DRAFT_478155 [Pisolithus orientalis]KAI5990324.1 hypothetical protein F5J12DRAFT_478155 [Pisolithus orientalis]